MVFVVVFTKTTNMTYTFIKVAPKVGSESDKKKAYWLFQPKSIEQIEEHWLKYPKSVISEAVAHLLRKQARKVMGHCNNDFERAVEALMQVNGDGVVACSLIVENQTYTNRMHSFLNGEPIHLNHGMQVVLIDERVTQVLEVVEKETLTFPDEERPSLSDVRYLTWDGGKHVYAKIGKLDVVDERGKQKWDTREEAEAAAKSYIEKNWK